MAKKLTPYKDRKNGLEWAVFGVGLVLVLTILGYLIYKTVTYIPGSPHLVMEYTADPGPHEPNRFHVVVHNRGNETAESITVALGLFREGKEVDKAELSIDFCPKESKREGWVAFSTRVSPVDTVRGWVVSYEKP